MARLALVRRALLLVPFAAASVSQAQTPDGEPSRFPDTIPAHVFRARSVALIKLRGERCRRLFAEFEDIDGRALDRVLAESDETAETRLSRITFRDGSHTPTCDRTGVFAFTSPGSLTVFVCPAFRLLAWREGKSAANVLIHEELHSLGAGEAPMPGLPSAKDITTRVEARCGR